MAESRRRTAAALFAAPGGDLVIGIGNSLRGDDGVGWWLARRAERWRPEAQVRSVQQLTPELAAELAQATRVLFIDAWLGPAQGGWPSNIGENVAWNESAAPLRHGNTAAPEPATPLPRLLRIGALEADGAGAALAPFSHQLSPETLLRIAELLQGHRPEAWQLLVPAFELAHGEGFSARQRALLPNAQTLLRQWLQGRNAAAEASTACMN